MSSSRMFFITREDSLRDFPDTGSTSLKVSSRSGSETADSMRAGREPKSSMSARAMDELTCGICWSMMIHMFSRHTLAFFSGLRHAA